MKTIIPLLLLLVSNLNIYAQEIQRIAVYDNTYSTTSGIIGITDTALYEYSWYYDSWLSFPADGLSFFNGHPIITEVAVCNNNSHNPSGIHVISDTSVHVYNYYAAYWYAFPNTGLEQVDGKYDISDLSVRYVSEDDEVEVFVTSGNHVYKYNYYTQVWYQLTNNGLTEIEKSRANLAKTEAYPNPIKSDGILHIKLPKENNESIHIQVFDSAGKPVFSQNSAPSLDGIIRIELPIDKMKSGIYFYEISGKQFTHVKQFICIR